MTTDHKVGTIDKGSISAWRDSQALLAKERGVLMTKFYNVALFVSMTLLFFTSAGLTKRLNGIASAEAQKGDNRLKDVQSASGKITAIQDDTFTIEIEQVKPPGAGFRQEDHASAMIFLINSGTKIEGKLEVGANAAVLYRQREQNVAVTVHVTSIS